MADFVYLWNNRARFSITSKAFYAAWAKRLLTFPSLIKRNRLKNKLIRDGAVIGATSEISNVILEGRRKNITVGENSFIAPCKLMLHEKIDIGNFVCINEGVRLITASHSLADADWHTIAKPIRIDDYAWIATEAIIMPGVHIGTGAVVGAGAIVSKDVAPYTIVAGNPAKPINRVRNKSLNYNPCGFLASNSAWLKG